MKAIIKIIDFGIDTQLKAEKNYITCSAVGTFNNMAPTVLNNFSSDGNIEKGYNEKCDIWPVGTVCYELLVGKPVFIAKSKEELKEKIK